MSPRKRILTLTIIAFSALLFACAKQTPVEKQPVSNFHVDVPHGIKNAEPDANISTSSDRTVSVIGGRGYVGTEIMYDAEETRERLKEIVTKDSTKEIYLQADPRAEYIDVVIFLEAIRGGGSQSIALIVRSSGQGTLQKLSVQLSKKPDPDDTSKLKPNPLALDVKVTGDGKLLLNQEQIATVQDVDKLTTSLTDVIKNRTSISDKTVSIKGTRKMSYGDIVKVIDAVKGTGASTIVLVLDDLV